MDKLREIVSQYGRWQDLSEYIDRIETHVDIDFSISHENSKALLESIAKEICAQKEIPIKTSTTINTLLKKAFFALEYPPGAMITQITTSLATIGQQFGELRNKIGATSHGKPLKEIKDRNNIVDDLSKDFLIDTTVIVASFLIRNFENVNPRSATHTSDEGGWRLY